jgi:lysophospholipase L1-like esterase
MHTYLALGDSYTCGEAVPTDQSFPSQLVVHLRAQGVEIAEPKVIAVTGWTTDELQQGIAGDMPTGTYDLVTLLIGVNNQYRGTTKGFTVGGYRKEFAELLQAAIRFARGKADHVIVVSIPDWGAMPFAEGQDRTKIGTDIDAYNAVNKEESARQGVQYVDITSLSRKAMDDPSLVASDGLHPSGIMYGQWVEALAPVATQALA